MVENYVYETKKSFVNVICSLRFIKGPVVWITTIQDFAINNISTSFFLYYTVLKHGTVIEI